MISLLRRMPYLETLSLYLLVGDQNRVIDGTVLQHDIFDYMPQLHSFTFYISTDVDTVNLSCKLSHEDIQQTLTNIGQQHVSSMFNSLRHDQVTCSIFSFPFEFDRLQNLGNQFPDIIFSYVTFLTVDDINPFKHEFFSRIARSFPLLKYLGIYNDNPSVLNDGRPFSSDNCQLYSAIEYPHLYSLNVQIAHRAYVEQLLDETKTKLPCLTQLRVLFSNLKYVTKNFTREETRRNCANVKQLFMMDGSGDSSNFYRYFPSFRR